jgi:hypothetical protein
MKMTFKFGMTSGADEDSRTAARRWSNGFPLDVEVPCFWWFGSNHRANYSLQLKIAGANYIWYSAQFFTFSSEERLWQALAPKLCSVVA